MSSSAKVKLVLGNGQEFYGAGFGAPCPAVGEIVFNTSVVGYQEIISDPAYAGQIVVMTYPPVGQYGITDEDYESRTPRLAGLVVRECSTIPSNFRFTKTLSEELEEHSIPCISGLDTRMIAHIIRNQGPMMAAVVPAETPLEEVLAMIGNYKREIHPVAEVSCRKRWFSRTPHHRFDVVILDCGVKHSTVEALNERGCNVTVVPFDSTVGEIEAFNPDGVLVSGGPGNPGELKEIAELINGLKGRCAIGGTGLGHLLIALSYGAKVEKMKCGHYGDMPVRNVCDGRIFTAMHSCHYCVDAQSAKDAGLEITQLNVVDSMVEGLQKREDRVFTAAFCPEGAPGPQESGFFDEFVKIMED